MFRRAATDTAPNAGRARLAARGHGGYNCRKVIRGTKVQITANVHHLRVNAKDYSGVYSPNVYLVADAGQAIIIDSGFADDDSATRRLDYLKGIGSPRVELIVITHHHLDHVGGARRLQEATGARIAMHPEEERLLRESLGRSPAGGAVYERDARRASAGLTVDLPLNDGDALPVGGLSLRVLHTPGHSPGHLCLFLEGEKVLFSGDNVLGLGTTAVPPPPTGDMARYIESLKRMKALNAALICPGHGPIVHQPERRIQELIDHRREREEQILALLRQGEQTLPGLRRAIYPELDPRLERMAMGQILSHIYKLQDEGKAVLRRSGDEFICSLPPSG